MMKRRLGRDGPEIGAIAFGCMSFGGFYGPTDEATSHRALDAAWDQGITHLDTANIYGMGVSEEFIGTYIRRHPGRFSIATKAGNTRNPERRFNNSPEHLRESLEASLRRLGVDHVELFYLHRREQALPIEGVMETMVRFKEEGKIGSIGLSEVSPGTLRRAATVHPIAAVQSEYSLWTRLPELGLLKACEDLGAAFVAFSPLGRGVFTDVMPDPATFPQHEFRRDNPRFSEENWRFNRIYAERFAAHARERGVSMASLALAWLLNRAPHVIPIPGTRTAEHVADWAPAGDMVLTAAEMAEIEEILPCGFAHGDRYNEMQNRGPERYC